MQDPGRILLELRERGYRLTRTRKAILDLFIRNPKPMSCADVRRLLSRAGTSVDKVTVYRELAFLREQGVILELRFGENVKYYEITPERHHHHIVCVDCDKVEDVELNKDLKSEERAIARNKYFRVISHSLEFFGVCRNCQVSHKWKQAIKS